VKIKDDLQKENDLLRDLVSTGTRIEGCTFNGSPSGEVCAAVTALAVANTAAAEALNGINSPMLTIETPKALSDDEES